ncbi:hypothetical protein L2E82_48192 [Cichorium intybus]|uniref:Uncharacterized protein n=1 Tax=Cichorium intybus TaxID=13427 RepID=A0ACB8YXQ1_CICIN|nr:hypothetical protein L2E82_48192 [Cichorium intybus]
MFQNISARQFWLLEGNKFANEKSWEPDLFDYFRQEIWEHDLDELSDANKGNIEIWKLPEIVDSSHLKSLRYCLIQWMPASYYTFYSGLSLLALALNAIHKLWKWHQSESNPSGKSTASIVPQLWQPTNGALMSNDVNESKPTEEPAACIALTKNNSYLISASSGKISLFNMMTFKVLTTFMPPPPLGSPSSGQQYHSTIGIYNIRLGEVRVELKGHQKQITGLAFSEDLYALFSSGADAQASGGSYKRLKLCMWDIISWKKVKSRSIESPPGHPSSLVGETKVQFHNIKCGLLVVHESQISIYDSLLECSRLWSPRESLSAAISSATYSCDGLLIFTGFVDGAVGVFDADTL